jgi:hypothetical protein
MDQKIHDLADVVAYLEANFYPPMVESDVDQVKNEIIQLKANEKHELDGMRLLRKYDYETRGPWHMWPKIEHGENLAELSFKFDDMCVRHRFIDDYCAKLQEEIIRAGFSARVAKWWADEIRFEANCAGSGC